MSSKLDTLNNRRGVTNVLALGTPEQIDELTQEIAFEIQTRQATDTRRIWRAMMLARTLEQCEALLAGEAIPLDQLDQKWVERFGLRKDAA